ncbi:MAG: CDP-glycerol glycerophosphotransferase (TagB/SpsB family) [Psychrosphaera sp.]|jgi:CDP-glycerol glycerophosphotransferase (TagB/SpsB family)
MRILLFISQNYSFEILRPIQEYALKNNDQVMWMLYGNNVDQSYFLANESFTDSIQEVQNFKPDAVFVPGNVVPSFIQGLKVQVFHGFEWKKKGHFKIRGCFDLYCTQGPFFTEKFAKLSEKHQFFDVVETGWTKLDKLFNAEPMPVNNLGLPIVLYAPTFSPSLSSAVELKDKIVALSKQNKFHWIVKFHPKMDKKIIEQYMQLQHEHLVVLETSNLSGLLQTSSVIVSDTSSVITEFMLLNKPAITYNNASPESALINITEPEQLNDALNTALNPTAERMTLITAYREQYHPCHDAKATQRVYEAVKSRVINGKLAPKALPFNLIRQIKMRKKFNYWKL